MNDESRRCLDVIRAGDVVTIVLNNGDVYSGLVHRNNNSNSESFNFIMFEHLIARYDKIKKVIPNVEVTFRAHPDQLAMF